MRSSRFGADTWSAWIALVYQNLLVVHRIYTLFTHFPTEVTHLHRPDQYSDKGVDGLRPANARAPPSPSILENVAPLPCPAAYLTPLLVSRGLSEATRCPIWSGPLADRAVG